MSYHLLAVGQTVDIPVTKKFDMPYKNEYLTTPNLQFVKEELHRPDSIMASEYSGTVTIKALSEGTGFVMVWSSIWSHKGPVSLEPIEIEVVKPEDLVEIDLHLLNDKIVGHSYFDSTEQFHGQSDETIPIKIRWCGGEIKFFRLDGEILYYRAAKPGRRGPTDSMFCVTNRFGATAGCPSGGLSGHGDGRLQNFNQATYLGSIKLRDC